MPLRRSRLAAALALAMGTAAAAAHSQDLRINVTGTNIKRTDAETAAPVEVITREDILASGLQTVSDVVRQITANNNGSIAPSFTNGFSASGSAVSLRGLGPNNTLVLLNGRRIANFGLADDKHISYVDLQQIPFDAVERIEILKDGASAIYGSDAVAGVVNVILRQQYTGTTVTATAGTTYNGDGNQIKGALTAGIGDLTRNRYNLFLTVDGQRQEAIPANRGRGYAGTNDLRYMGLPDWRPGRVGGGVLPAGLLGNVIPVSASNPDGPPVAGSAWRSLPGPCAPSSQDGPFCRWETKDYVDLLPEITRYNVYGRATYDFGNDFQAYAEASYFHVETTTRNLPLFPRAIWSDPATGGIRSTLNLHLPVGHPDNPFSAQNQVALLAYADSGIGGGQATYDTGTQRYLAGLKGRVSGWDFDAAALYIRSGTDITYSHLYSYDRLMQGLAGTAPYGYYRIGGSAAVNDPAIYDWIAPPRAYSTISENTVVDAKASRDIGRLDGGAAALAVGYEYRREELRNPGIPGSETGDIVGIGFTGVTGSRTINALYAELFAPVLRNVEVSAAVRYDHYSDVGSTTNPKAGIKWTVVPQLVLRGTWQTAFRAPGLYEAGASSDSLVIRVNDPVRCPITNSPADCGAIVAGGVAGNASLQPETSTTWTTGVVWEPVPGLSAIVDYWNIRTKGQITIPEFQAVLDNPAAYPGFPIQRGSNDLPGIPGSGSLLFVGTGFINANLVKTDGFDVDIVWRQRLGEYGMLRTELQWTHVLQFVQSFGSDATYDFVATQGPYSVSSAGGTPQDRANLILGWTRGPLSITGTVRYVGGYDEINWQGYDAQPRCLPPRGGSDCHVASFTTLDLAASYGGWKNWQIFGSVINVFNRMPPFNPAAAYGNVNYNYNWAYSGATGIQFNLGMRYTFD